MATSVEEEKEMTGAQAIKTPRANASSAGRDGDSLAPPSEPQQESNDGAAKASNGSHATVDKSETGDGNESPSKTEVDAKGEAAANKDEATKTNPQRKRKILLIAGAVILLAAVGGLFYWLNARHYESTDDAFIEATIVQVSPKVSGYVQKLYVTDNQAIKEGDLLVELDARDYEARLEQARAALNSAIARRNAAQTGVTLTRTTTNAGVQQAQSGVEAARAAVTQMRAQVEAAQARVTQAAAGVSTATANAQQAQAQVGAAQAEALRARNDAARYRALYEKDEVSRQRYEQAEATARTAEAQLEAAQKRVAAANAQIAEARAAQDAFANQVKQANAQVLAANAQVGQATGRLSEAGAAPEQVALRQSDVTTAEAEIARAQTAVAQAELDLSYTKIYAPASGRVTRRAIEEGSLLQPGQALFAVVPNDYWVVANFKETQLKNMRVGQSVEVKIDAYPDKHFKAHVDSIQSGTGSRFSLLPPENATGNYVKVVQRVPVKIVFDEKPDEQHLLAPGMSVEPEVKVR